MQVSLLRAIWDDRTQMKYERLLDIEENDYV